MSISQQAQSPTEPTEETSTLRSQLLKGLPVTESQYRLAGISTKVLEGGEGTPMVLLHGPGEYAAKWLRVIPTLVKKHRVIIPDLPGHGASIVNGDSIDANAVMTWLKELIEVTCPTPPVLVGQILGGAIAARFACEHSDRISRLVLVDSLGLTDFQPAPEFGQALMAFIENPNSDTHDQLWNKCAHNLDQMRVSMGESWERVKAYNLDRASDARLGPIQHSLMGAFGMPAIPETELSRISVPTSLIWGEHDLATSLSVARQASEKYGWSLQVIAGAGDDAPLEHPETFVATLQSELN